MYNISQQQFPFIAYFLSQRAPSYMLHRTWIKYCNMINKNSKRCWGYTSFHAWSSATLVFHIKLSSWDLIWIKWSSHQLIHINCGFVTNFGVGNIQLLCHHKMAQICTCLFCCLHLFGFGSPLPLNYVNLTSTPIHHHYHYCFHQHLSQKRYFLIL